MGIVPVIVRKVSSPPESIPETRPPRIGAHGAGGLDRGGMRLRRRRLGAKARPPTTLPPRSTSSRRSTRCQFVAEQVGGDARERLQPDTRRRRAARSRAHGPRAASLQEADLVVYLERLHARPSTTGSTTSAPGVRRRGRRQPRPDRIRRRRRRATRTRRRRDRLDPHFWLDPTRLADVADAVADRFGELAPDDADVHRERRSAAGTTRSTRRRVPGRARRLCQHATSSRATRPSATSRARYGLTQIGITGLSPDEEPSPARLAEVTDFVEDERRAHDLLRDARRSVDRRDDRRRDGRDHGGPRPARGAHRRIAPATTTSRSCGPTSQRCAPARAVRRVLLR